MKNLIILVLILAIAFALPNKELRPRNVVVPAGRLEGRITRGIDAVEGQFPYQAGISVHHNKTHTSWCGGALIHHEWVLTAAHCTLNAKKLRVELGTINRLIAPVIDDVTTREIFNHPAYNKENYYINDIALVKIPYTNYTKYIQRALLPTIDTGFQHKTGIASGWGRIGDLPENRTDTLKWARLSIISNDVCNQTYVGIFDSNICTATVGGVNICNGDSGGPLVLENTKILVGLTSYGRKSCFENEPSVYTRVSKYIDWIEKTTGGAVNVKKLSRKQSYRKIQ